VLGNGFLTFANFRKFIDTNPLVRSIELSNYGEIFLNPELPDMLEYAYRCAVALHAGTGVNLNTVGEKALEGAVRFGLRTMTCSIDGASRETYRRYRVGGNFERVISNIRRINAYKRLYNSPHPALTWQFVVFGHNEHEVAAARAQANELQMAFHIKLSWDPDISPVRDAESVRREAGAASRKEYKELYGRGYAHDCCKLLWDAPQINWDGRMLGCDRNFWGDFGANAFTDGLAAAINGQEMCYARDMLQGRRPPRPGIPCTTCDLYLDMQATGCWVERPRPPWGYRTARCIHRILGLHHIRRLGSSH